MTANTNEFQALFFELKMLLQAGRNMTFETTDTALKQEDKNEIIQFFLNESLKKIENELNKF
jgi:hypothetical protein